MGETSPRSNAQTRHDAHTYLQVITMGLELLKNTREESDRFNEMIELIQKDAIDPLRALVTELLERLEEPQTEKRS